MLGKVTAFLGGLTALILAIVGLKAAWLGLFPPQSSSSSQNVEIASGRGSSDDAGPKQAQGGAATAESSSDVKSASSQRLPEESTTNFSTSYSKPNGHLVKKNDSDWVESDDTNGVKFFFKEQSRDASSIVLYDTSRSTYLKVPIKGGEVYWSLYNPVVWRELYFVTADAN